MAKSARELTREELRSYRPWGNLERYQKDTKVLIRRQRAWETARVAAGLLKTDYGATRVIAFGSLVHATRFTPWSDVDLAAWGIVPALYYRAAGAALDLGLEIGIRIHVVDPKDCSPEFLEGIDQEGVEL